LERAEIAIFGFSWIGAIGLDVACTSCRRQLHYTEKLVPNLSQMNTREATTATPTADVTHPTERLQGVRPKVVRQPAGDRQKVPTSFTCVSHSSRTNVTAWLESGETSGSQPPQPHGCRSVPDGVALVKDARGKKCVRQSARTARPWRQ